MTYNKPELEELSIKYFGENHADLSPQKKLIKFLEDNIPLDSLALKAAVEGAGKLDSTQANESLYDMMAAIEKLPEALDKLEAALLESEKKSIKKLTPRSSFFLSSDLFVKPS